MKIVSLLIIAIFCFSCTKMETKNKITKHKVIFANQEFEMFISTNEKGDEIKITSPLTNNQEIDLKLEEMIGNKTYAGMNSKYGNIMKINGKAVQGLIISPYYGLFINRVKSKLEQQGKSEALGCPEITTKALIFLVGSNQESVFACVI